MGDWYYIGHYGRLGPLTLEQIEELVGGGVIAPETYVWRNGMVDWIPASQPEDLRRLFARPDLASPPPPPPGMAVGAFAGPSQPSGAPAASPYGGGYGGAYSMAPASPMGSPVLGYVRSDRSRALSGILQFILPGVGRIYLGYAAIGVMQLVLSLCGVGWIWSVIDGIIILTGGVKMDGYGRALVE